MGAGASEYKNKEGRKLIKNYQKRHMTLTQSKDDRHMRRLFNLYGGKKGYLDEREAKLFIKDVLFVCELTKEIPDLQATIDGIFRELDPAITNKIQYSELLKPSWGKVQDLLHTVYGKMNNLNGISSSTDSPYGSPVVTRTNPRLIGVTTPTVATTSSPGTLRLKSEDSADISDPDFEECCPPSFICPISTEIMSDPVMLVETKTTYDRKSIEQWLLQHNSDPSTGLELRSKDIISLLVLKNAIEEWKIDMKDMHKKKEKKEKRKKRKRKRRRKKKKLK